ncbi:MAG TPA: LuxR C-terminal-related transcriptional regulator [Dehalococcoidia bacterium]|nr:LuxR C-terminal-related transcriptional regulator [Dehalococcoidia bacterium]
MASTRRRGRPPHPDVLTPTEWSVVHAVRHGMTNRMIATGRGISLDAVKQHVASAVGKLGLENRAALRKWSGAPVDSALSRRESTMTTTQLNLGSLGQISRHVADVRRSEAWYKDVLGLKHLFTFPSSVGDLAFFDCGGTRLFLSNERGDAPGEQNVLYFTVADINGAYTELGGRSVEFIDAPHMIFKHPDGTEEWMAFFKDCDGQTLGLMSQVKA